MPFNDYPVVQNEVRMALLDAVQQYYQKIIEFITPALADEMKRFFIGNNSITGKLNGNPTFGGFWFPEENMTLLLVYKQDMNQIVFGIIDSMLMTEVIEITDVEMDADEYEFSDNLNQIPYLNRNAQHTLNAIKKACIDRGLVNESGRVIGDFGQKYLPNLFERS